MSKLPFSFHNISIKSDQHSPSDAYYLWLVLFGEVYYEGDFGNCDLRSSSVVLIANGEMGRVSPRGDNLILTLRFDPDFFDGRMRTETAPIFCNSELRQGDYSPVRRLMSMAAEAYFDQDSRDELHLTSLVYELMHVLYAQFSLVGDAASQEARWNTDRRVAIERFIHKNYREPLTLSALAEEFHLSYQYLSRYFKDVFGVNFLSYLKNVRLKCAIKDLKNRVPISLAAIGNGFSNTGAFSQAFKEKYGMSPSAYMAGDLPDSPRDPDDNSIMESGGAVSPKTHLERYLPEEAEGEDADSSVRRRYTVCCAGDRPIDRTWSEILNLEYAENCLDHAFQEQVRSAQSEIGFRYGRIKGVVDENVFPGLLAGGAINVVIFSKIIDFLLSVGLTPFIELSPRQTDALHGRVSGPDIAPSKYERALREIFLYCTKRWGEDEVERWRFTLCFPYGGDCSRETVWRYCRRFRAARAALRDYIANGRLGGPDIPTAAGSSALLEQLARQLQNDGAVPDFLSIRLFPGVYEAPSGEQVLVYGDENTCAEKVERLACVFRGFFPDSGELFITEFGSDSGSRSPLNDTCRESAYITRIVLSLFDKVSGMGYWHFSDLGRGGAENNRLLFGGSGMLTVNGVRKSAYHAFKLLGELGRRLVECGANFIVTRRSRGRVIVLMHNSKDLSPAYCAEYCKSGVLPEDRLVYDDLKPLALSLCLTGLRKGSYMLKTYTVDREHGDLSKIVEDFNYNYILRGEEADYLRGVCVPHQRIDQLRSEGSIELEHRLKPNEVKLIAIISDEE